MGNAWFDDDKKVRETLLKSEEVFRGRFLRIARDTVRCADGSVHTREFVRHPGACVMVALDEQRQTVIEWQWREPCGKAFVEFPAGKKDPHEDPFDCARRELIEEAGLAAGRLVHLGTMRNAIGYSDEAIEVFVATRLSSRARHLDGGECLEVKKAPFEQVYAACLAGEIEDVKTLVAAFWTKAWLEGSRQGEERTFPAAGEAA